MTASDTVADVLAARLRAHGVDLFFGQSLPSRLVLAAEDAGIRQVVYRTENAGGAMADGYARIRRSCGFVVAQNGPAATLLVAPLTEALHASVPIVALVQEVPSTHRGRNAFQEIDHRALFAGFTTWFGTLDDGARAEESLDAAIRAATTGRPGPAVPMLPKDMLEQRRIPMVSTESHIVPVLVGDAHKCKQLADILLHEHAEYAQPINFPSVPRGTERLRINPSPVHSPAAVRRFVDLVDDAWTLLELPRTPEIGAGAPRLNEERHQAVLG